MPGGASKLSVLHSANSLGGLAARIPSSLEKEGVGGRQGAKKEPFSFCQQLSSSKKEEKRDGVVRRSVFGRQRGRGEA